MYKECEPQKESGKKKDINPGDKYGRLTVIKEEKRIRYKSGQTARRFLCLCECGKEKIITLSNLSSGNTTSCGCVIKETAIKLRGKPHPELRKTKIYDKWINMKKGCKIYKPYVEKNISVCEEWNKDFLKFYEWSMKNGYDDSKYISRIDKDKGYSPENCEWVEKHPVCNIHPTRIFISFNGETHSIKEWSKITGINYQSIYSRLKSGKKIEDALTTPVKNNRNVN